MTMQLISTVTVGAGGAATIDFTSIPQTATDLLVVFSLRSSSTGNSANGGVRLNGDSGSNYFVRTILGNGSAASSSNNTANKATGWWFSSAGNPANTFGNGAFYIPNYTGATMKTFTIDSVSENSTSVATQALTAALWNGTAAVSSISIIDDSTGIFAQYSTASLYAITKGSGGATVTTA